MIDNKNKVKLIINKNYRLQKYSKIRNLSSVCWLDLNDFCV